MRRTGFRRIAAAVASGVLAAAGGVVLTSPAAHATEVSAMWKCTNKLAPGLDIPPSETRVELRVSPAQGDKYTVGDLVTVTWVWFTYPVVPPNSPIPSLPADSTKPVGQIEVTGAQSGTVTVEGERKNAETPKGQPLIVSTMTGTLALTAAGTVNLEPKKYSTFTQIGPLDAETECLPLTPPGISASITVEPGQAAQPVLDAPTGTATPGAEIGLTGRDFAPNATPQVSLCATDGGDCVAERFTTNTLAIDGSGALTGKAKLAGTLTPGNYLVKVGDGANAATTPLTVQPGAVRIARVSPTSGPVGTTVTVTGTGFTPGKFVYVVGTDDSGIAGPGTKTATVLPDGTFSLTVTVESANITQIRIREGAPSSSPTVFVPFTVTTGPAPGTQAVDVTFAPGQLSMSQAGTGIDFGTATLNGQAQQLTAPLNQVTVTDSRGGTSGWSLTGTMTDLVAANGTDKIPAGNMSWAPSCAALPGSLSTVTSGSTGPLGSAATLCSQAADTKATGGRFTADAQITLTTPEFAAAGAYSGTLTLSLI